MLAVIGLLQRRPGEADHPVAMRQRLDPAVDGLALLGRGEQARRRRTRSCAPAARSCRAPRRRCARSRSPWPRGTACAAAAAARTRPGWCRRSPPSPPAAGSRPSNTARSSSALRSSSRNTAVSFCGPMAFSITVTSPATGPRHRGMEARVLPQDPGQQRRARARQPGDEMEPGRNRGGVGGHGGGLLVGARAQPTAASAPLSRHRNPPQAPATATPLSQSNALDAPIALDG